MCNQGKCSTIYGIKLLTVYRELNVYRNGNRMGVCDLFEFALSMSLCRIRRHLVSDSIGEFFLLLAFLVIQITHKRRRWGFNFTQQYRISFPISISRVAEYTRNNSKCFDRPKSNKSVKRTFFLSFFFFLIHFLLFLNKFHFAFLEFLEMSKGWLIKSYQWHQVSTLACITQR